MGKQSKEPSNNSTWDSLSAKQAAFVDNNGKLDGWGSWDSALNGTGNDTRKQDGWGSWDSAFNETGNDTWKQRKDRNTLDDSRRVTYRKHQKKPKSPCLVSNCHPKDRKGGCQAESPASKSPPQPRSNHFQRCFLMDAGEEAHSIKTSWGLNSSNQHASGDGSRAAHYDWEQLSLRQAHNESRKHLKRGISPDHCFHRYSRDGVEAAVTQFSHPSGSYYHQNNSGAAALNKVSFNSSSMKSESRGRTTLLHSDAKKTFHQWSPPLDRHGLQAREQCRRSLSPYQGLKSPSEAPWQEKGTGGPYSPSSRSCGTLNTNGIDTHREGVSSESSYGRKMAFRDDVLDGEFCGGGRTLGQSISDSWKQNRHSWNERSPSFYPNYVTKRTNGPRQSTRTFGNISPVGCASPRSGPVHGDRCSKRYKDMYYDIGTSEILEHTHVRVRGSCGDRCRVITSSLRDGGNFTGGWLCGKGEENKHNRCTYGRHEGRRSEGSTPATNYPDATSAFQRLGQGSGGTNHDRRHVDNSFGQVVGSRHGFDGFYKDCSECFPYHHEQLQLASTEVFHDHTDSWRYDSNAQTNKIQRRKCPGRDDQTATSDGGRVGRKGRRGHRRRYSDEFVRQRVGHHGVYDISYKDPSENFYHHNERSPPEVHCDHLDARRNDKLADDVESNKKVEWNDPKCDEQAPNRSNGAKHEDRKAAASRSAKWGDEMSSTSKGPNGGSQTATSWNGPKLVEGGGIAHLRQSLKQPSGSACTKGPQSTITGKAALRNNTEDSPSRNPDSDLHQEEPGKLSQKEVSHDHSDARRKARWDCSAETEKEVQLNGPQMDGQPPGVSHGQRPLDGNAAAHNGSKRDDEKESASKSSNRGSNNTASWNGPKWDEQMTTLSTGRRKRDHTAAAHSCSKGDNEKEFPSKSPNWSGKNADSWKGPNWGEVSGHEHLQQSPKRPTGSGCTKSPQNTSIQEVLRTNPKNQPSAGPDNTSAGQADAANMLGNRQLDSSQDPIKKMSSREGERGNQAKIYISEAGPPGLHTDGKSSASIDERSLRRFRFSLADFVKDVLKPMWEEGFLSKEVHKLIAKKVVDKVTGSLGSNIPQTQVHIGEYLSFASERIATLVQEYVEIYVGKKAVEKTA